MSAVLQTLRYGRRSYCLQPGFSGSQIVCRMPAILVLRSLTKMAYRKSEPDVSYTLLMRSTSIFRPNTTTTGAALAVQISFWKTIYPFTLILLSMVGL